MIREQCNEDGTVKLTSVDFITYLAWSLEGFLTMMNDQTFDVCGAVVDTFTEAIQGPCKGNQLALVQNKIIDTAREIISGFEREQELIFLNFVTDDDIDAIGEFKGNVIQLLTSLLEGETDMEMVQTMTLSLDFLNMKNRMNSIFKRFAEKILNKEEEGISIHDAPLHKIDNLLEGDSFQDNI